jgi:hypothetical protein
MITKLIFLDIDGVLNSVRNTTARKRPWTDSLPHFVFEEQCLDPVAVDLLRVLCDETGATIVISSTWRHSRNHQDFIDIFNVYGWDNFPIIGMTPRLNTIRGLEIAAWLEEFVKQGNVIESYIILDDSSDMLPSQMEHLVHTTLMNGLLLNDYINALKMLDPTHIDLSPTFLGAYLDFNGNNQ